MAHFSGVVSLLVDVAKEYDEVVVKLTSPGGAVAEYGQLAMQLLRLRKVGRDSSYIYKQHVYPRVVIPFANVPYLLLPCIL